MKVIGVLTTLAFIAAAVGAILVGLSNRKDVERYMKIRRM